MELANTVDVSQKSRVCAGPLRLEALVTSGQSLKVRPELGLRCGRCVTVRPLPPKILCLLPPIHRGRRLIHALLDTCLSVATHAPSFISLVSAFLLSSLYKQQPLLLSELLTFAQQLRAQHQIAMDEQAYLEPDFDPSTFTVPQLRSVLVAHSVNYPSSAKKAELINLFNENVVSQAKKLRAASARVKRTSRGIVNVPASQADEEEDDELPPPPSTGRRSGGRTTRARTEEAQEVMPNTRATRHSTAPPEATPRGASSKHARIAEEDVVQEPERKRPASRKSRPAAATPIVKAEDEDTSNFSNENVFQARSSPIEQTDRRRTTSTTKDADRRRSKEVRRRTDEVKPVRQQMDGAVVPTRKTFEMPVSALKKEEVETSEEFTPEETQELVRAQQAGELVAVQPRARSNTSKTARNGVNAVMVAMLAGMAALWGQEKFQVGYCGVGLPSRAIAGVEVPEWADAIRPDCEICPPHAICNDKLETTCEPGFVLTHHPLSLSGYLPIPPTCEPDSARAKRVSSAKQSVVEVLRKHNAKYECGDAETPEVKEEELKTAFKTKSKRGKMSNEEFEDLWNSAIGEVRAADEISVGVDG